MHSRGAVPDPIHCRGGGSGALGVGHSLCAVTWGAPGRSAEGDELGATGGAMADLSVLDGLVGHGVLSEVLAHHLGLDLDGGPVLAGVDLADGADHLGHDDGVTEVGLHGLGLLAVRGVLDGGLELLDEAVVLGVHAVLEAAALAGLEKSDDLCGVHLEELVELDTSVNLLLEWLSLGDLARGGNCVGHIQLTKGVGDIK